MKKIYNNTEIVLKKNLVCEKNSGKPITGLLEKYDTKGKLKQTINYNKGKLKKKISYKKEEVVLIEYFNENNICFYQKEYKGKILLEKHFAGHYNLPDYLITEEKWILVKKENAYHKHGFWQERHSPKSNYYSRGEYNKGIRVGLWKAYHHSPSPRGKIELSPSEFLTHRSDSLALTFYRKNGFFQMSYSNYKYGDSKNIIVGNNKKNGKRSGWWYWFSVKKLSKYFSDKDYKNDLEKLWDYWTFDPKQEIPKEMLKLINKKIFY